MMAANVAESVLPVLIQNEADHGTPVDKILRILVRSMQTSYRTPAALLKLAGVGGRLELLGREGGCVDAKAAAIAYLGHSPKKAANAETVRKAARENRLVAIRDGHGDLLFPVWQFSQDGGALPGLGDMLKILAQGPIFSEITPFVFFLQSNSITSGTPLAALRDGRLDAVIEAATASLD